MGGVSLHPELANNYLAFVLHHTTGEYLGYQSYSTLDEALAAINQVQRKWTFEASSGCGSGNCGKEGGCNPAGCKVKLKSGEGSCSTGNC